MARSRKPPPSEASVDRPEDAAGDGHEGADPAVADVPAPPAIALATPSMAQYLEIKAANPDSLLWYRMGDFYELFFEDAVTASAALGIVLTKRGRHLGEEIPMCGVPVVRADDYLQRLIRLGYRVAVCEQLEDPAEARKRGSKAVVRRDVVRLVTPGTLTEDALLDARSRNYLTALFALPAATGASTGPDYALASLELSTGEFEVGTVATGDLAGELVRLSASEILLPERLHGERAITSLARGTGAATTPLASAFFDSLAGERLLQERLGVRELGGFGTFSRSELAAIGALLKYVDLTQLGARPVVRPPRRIGAGSALLIDAATRSSLELLRSSRGERDGSLLAAIDRTVTGAGARELAARLASPLCSVPTITARLDALQHLVDQEPARAAVRAELRGAPDIARAIARLSLNRSDPRDLAFVRDALAIAVRCAGMLAGTGTIDLPADLAAIKVRLAAVDPALCQRLTAALVESPGTQRRDGGFIRPGFRADLDDARALSEDSRRVMAALEARYVEVSGVRTLRIRHNNILGYFLEVGAQSAKPLLTPPLDATFRHRQTMASAVRFTTAELEEIEGRIASAGERALAIEQEVFGELSSAVLAATRPLLELAAALAELDVTAALAELAETEGYVRPELDEGQALEIRDGRHPVVEQALRAAKSGPFVANDCLLGSESDIGRPSGLDESARGRIWLVTGPNMAGKSTFLRQAALIVVLAQMGAFVPASVARIGLVDRLFSRVGAADDLARGRSTFMVEMVETAAILNQAGPQSLVILDEIGRGTATYDGLSIAWATVEYLHDVSRCRALFATHYHELTVLAGRLAEVANATIDVKEWNDEIVFLHKVRAGAADRSYGIQVAKLAGLPRPVIARASEVLARLEATGSRPTPDVLGIDDLPLFAATRPRGGSTTPVGPSPLEVALGALSPDELSPKAALEALYRLKALLATSARGGRSGLNDRDDTP